MTFLQKEIAEQFPPVPQKFLEELRQLGEDWEGLKRVFEAAGLEGREPYTARDNEKILGFSLRRDEKRIFFISIDSFTPMKNSGGQFGVQISEVNEEGVVVIDILLVELLAKKLVTKLHECLASYEVAAFSTAYQKMLDADREPIQGESIPAP